MEGARQDLLTQSGGGLAAGAVGDQFRADHQSLAAHVADAVEALLQLAQAREQVIADLGGIGRIFALHEIERGQRRGATDWVTAEGVAVRAALPFLHVSLPRDHQSDRQPRAQALGERHDVRRHAPMLAREHLAGAADAALYFVEDQEDPVAIA